MLKFAAFEVQAAVLVPKNASAQRLARMRRQAHRHNFDYEPRRGFLYVRSRAISSRTNDNYDEFPAEEIAKSYKTFIGKPVFVNHVNHDHRRARGVVIDAVLHKDTLADGHKDWWAEVLMEIDAQKFPKLAKAIMEGRIDRTSMGCDVAYSICSMCGNKASTPAEYCTHIPRLKGKKVLKRNAATGAQEEHLIRETCYGLKFFENSVLVEEPADPTAFTLGDPVMGPDTKVASRHVRPPLATENLANDGLGDAVADRDLSLGQLPSTGTTLPDSDLRSQRSDLSDLGVSEFGGPVAHPDQTAASDHHVPGVGPGRTGDPVRRVVAQGEVAGVPDQVPGRDGSDEGLVSPAVGANAAAFGVVEGQPSVPVGEDTAGPGPAVIRPEDGDLRPVARKNAHEGQHLTAFFASRWKDWEAPDTRCAICKQDATRLDDGGLEHEDLELDEHHDFIPEAGEPDSSYVVSYYDKDGNWQIVLPPHEARRQATAYFLGDVDTRGLDKAASRKTAAWHPPSKYCQQDPKRPGWCSFHHYEHTQPIEGLPCGCGNPGHTMDEHADWAKANNRDAWGRPIKQPYDGHGAFDCNNRNCVEHPPEMYDMVGGQHNNQLQSGMPGWMKHDLQSPEQKEIGREIGRHFHEQGMTEDARWLMEQPFREGPTKYSLFQHFAAAEDYPCGTDHWPKNPDGSVGGPNALGDSDCGHPECPYRPCDHPWCVENEPEHTVAEHIDPPHLDPGHEDYQSAERSIRESFPDLGEWVFPADGQGPSKYSALEFFKQAGPDDLNYDPPEQPDNGWRLHHLEREHLRNHHGYTNDDIDSAVERLQKEPGADPTQGDTLYNRMNELKRAFEHVDLVKRLHWHEHGGDLTQPAGHQFGHDWLPQHDHSHPDDPFRVQPRDPEWFAWKGETRDTLNDKSPVQWGYPHDTYSRDKPLKGHITPWLDTHMEQSHVRDWLHPDRTDERPNRMADPYWHDETEQWIDPKDNLRLDDEDVHRLENCPHVYPYEHEARTYPDEGERSQCKHCGQKIALHATTKPSDLGKRNRHYYERKGRDVLDRDFEPFWPTNQSLSSLFAQAAQREWHEHDSPERPVNHPHVGDDPSDCERCGYDDFDHPHLYQTHKGLLMGCEVCKRQTPRGRSEYHHLHDPQRYEILQRNQGGKPDYRAPKSWFGSDPIPDDLQEQVGDLGDASWLLDQNREGPSKYSSLTSLFQREAARPRWHLGPGENEGWTECDQGHQHWGYEGAAGLLLRHTDEKGTRRYLLQHRAPWVDHGDTYSIPGGAINPGESPEEAARREAHEEIGHLPKDLKHVRTHSDEHGGWAYHTVIMDSPTRFDPQDAEESGESGSGWFTKDEIRGLPLHPGFAKSWGKVSEGSRRNDKQDCQCCYGTGEHRCGHECYVCDASGDYEESRDQRCDGHHGRPPTDTDYDHVPDLADARYVDRDPEETRFMRQMTEQGFKGFASLTRHFASGDESHFHEAVRKTGGRKDVESGPRQVRHPNGKLKRIGQDNVWPVRVKIKDRATGRYTGTHVGHADKTYDADRDQVDPNQWPFRLCSSHFQQLKGDIARHNVEATDHPHLYEPETHTWPLDPTDHWDIASCHACTIGSVNKAMAGKQKKDDGPTHSGMVLKAADTGRVLMIQRSNADEKDPARGTWEFPGGGHEDGDLTSLHAAIREWEEEVGQPFPEGGNVVHTWRSPNGVYQGHVVVVPNEAEAVDFSNGRSTVNPDDPDGDDHEQSAWWEIRHAKENPALRPECKKSPWDEIRKAKYGKTALMVNPAEEHRMCVGCGQPSHWYDKQAEVSLCDSCKRIAQGFPDDVRVPQGYAREHLLPNSEPYQPDREQLLDRMSKRDVGGVWHAAGVDYQEYPVEDHRGDPAVPRSAGNHRNPHVAASSVPNGVNGTVYLLHFDKPFGHAKHYMGWAQNLEARLAHHEAGTGANLLRHVKAAGIGWTLARTWEGDRHLERRMKVRGHSRRCPICKEGSADDTIVESDLPPKQGARDETLPGGYLHRDVTDPNGPTYWAEPAGEAPYDPVMSHHGIEPHEEGHGPWHKTRHPQTRAWQLVDNQNRLVRGFATIGHPKYELHDHEGERRANHAWVQANQDHGHMPKWEDRDGNEADFTGMGNAGQMGGGYRLKGTEHANAGTESEGPVDQQHVIFHQPPPPFAHGTKDPKIEEYKRQARENPAPEVTPPKTDWGGDASSPEDEWHGPYRVIKHGETGKYHVVDNQNRVTQYGGRQGVDEQHRAEFLRDYCDGRQSSKEKARGFAENLWGSTMEVLDPGGTDESRATERSHRNMEKLMERYRGGDHHPLHPGRFGYDEDEDDNGEPYYEVEDPHGSGWTARDYGGTAARIYHKATGDTEHDMYSFPTSKGYDKPEGFGHDELHQVVRNFAHGDPSESEENRYAPGPDHAEADPRIKRWQRRRGYTATRSA